MRAETRQTLGRMPRSTFGCFDLPLIDPKVIEGYFALPDLTGMISDAMDLMGIHGAVAGSLLSPTMRGRRVVGPALTALNRKRNDSVAAAVAARDNRLGDIEAHNLARPGDILVVQGVEGISSLGGIAASIALRQGEVAIIVDGSVRDIESSKELGLPIWARGVTPLTGKWRLETIGINVPVTIAGVQVHPGDLVAADDTGVCFIPHAAIVAVLDTAQEIAQNEAVRLKAIADGAPLRDVMAPRRAAIDPQPTTASSR